MSEDIKQGEVRRVFQACCSAISSEEMDGILERECQGDTALCRAVQRLLHAECKHDAVFEDSPDSLLCDFKEGDVDVTRAASSDDAATVTAEKAGSSINGYKLLQQIGEGGMGAVYMAQQLEPVRRKVALKLIKPGMDSKDVIARFEAERQALAMMDHPNVAKVLDAGTTETGRPYFVMELVHGTPITKFCDENRLSNRDRLEIFVDVCRAVHHAHMKGIIHRDLKPSNVLVTMNDDKPMPKVIDFGVSKALSEPLTEKTMFTAFGQMVGTPLYMSPEQAQFSAHDVDVRSDVYSLGVLLYELLTGDTPFDRETLRNSGIDELRRLIREVEPERPSARVSTLRAELLSTVTERRRTEGRKLSQSLQGELDWIVMKSLEKDRTRRYESASDLAADIQRYLDDQPVEACPPTIGYRLQKRLRRNKRLLASGAVIAAALLVATCISTWYALETNQALAVAEKERRQSQTDYERAVEAIDLMIEHVASDEFDAVPGMIQIRENLFASALEFFDQIAAEHPSERAGRLRQAEALRKLQHVYGFMGRPQESLESAKQSVRIGSQLLQEFPEDPEVRLTVGHIYRSYAANGNVPSDERKRYLDSSIEIFESLAESDNGEIADQARSKLSGSYSRMALSLPTKEVDRKRALLKKAIDYSSHEVTMETVLALLRKAHLEQWWGEHAEAAIAAEQAVAAARAWMRARREIDGATHNGRYSRQLLYEALVAQAKVMDSLQKQQTAAESRAEALKIAQQLKHEFPEHLQFHRWVLAETVSNPDQFREYFEKEMGQLRGKTVRNLVQIGRARSIQQLLTRLHKQGKEEDSRALFDDLVEASKQFPDARLDLATMHTQYAFTLFKSANAKPALSDAINRYPEVSIYRLYRAAHYRQIDELDAARADVKQAVELGIIDAGMLPAYQASLLLLSLDMVSDHHNACEKLIETYRDSTDPSETFFTAWTCALRPNAIDDYTTAIELASRSVAKDKDNRQYLSGLGAILFRAGKSKEAKENLQKALEIAENDNTSSSYLHYFLAMTEHDLGNIDAAVQQLRNANALADEELAGSPLWNRKLTLELLRKEAEALVDPTKVENEQATASAPEN